MNNFYINEKNIINIKNQNYYLKSKNYLTNELYRFGGINSIRGFAENSLQANLTDCTNDRISIFNFPKFILQFHTRLQLL